MVSDSPPGTGVYIDISDLVEFYAREESASGVQRVIEGITPHFLARDARPIGFDRTRGVFVELSVENVHLMLDPNTERSGRAVLARSEITSMATASPLQVSEGSTIFFPGAVWINDSLMLAAWGLAATGAHLVYLLYDLTPVFEAGHTAAVNQLFERYLWLVAHTADRVPAISRSSRTDFQEWCAQRGLVAPPGSSPGLPNGIGPAAATATETPWPRPYALMVGTIESRKNHLFALHAWQRLLHSHAPDEVPDLICVGRLGWHAEDFLDEFVASRGLSGKVHLLTSSLGDSALADLYAHADFTIYPSRYEGWGLPVSESLAFGKVTISANNSSLPEAGGDLAVYFPTDDLDAFVQAIETFGLNERRRADMARHIEASATSSITWEGVAREWENDVLASAHLPRKEPFVPAPALNTEYMLASPLPAPDGAHADVYLQHLTTQRITPMLSQPRGKNDFEITDGLITGQLGAPQTWGLEIHPQRPITFRLMRPVSGDLVLLVSTRSMPGRVMVDVVTPGGDQRIEVYLGSVLTIPLGAGEEGTPATAIVTVTDASDSIEGFLGLRSIAVLRADDQESEVIALRAQASALRQELDFITNTRSWKVTAPLRRWRGRAAP